MIRQATKQEIDTAKAAGNPLPLFPLGLALEGCFTEEQMNSNFYATLERGYTPINDYLGKFSGVCSVVGAGPSIGETYKDLKGDVFAINSAIKFLLGKDIIPKWAMIWDCDQICENFAVPHPDITYLIASRAHPKVFERLKDCKVIVWHAAGDLNISKLMNDPYVIAKQPCEEPLINGGTAGVTRGLYVASSLGYTEVNIYGGDSCYSNDGKTHIAGSLVPEKDITITIGNDPPFYFRTTPEWCCQVEEYKAIYAIQTCVSGIEIHVHGESMLKHMHDIIAAQRDLWGKKKFFETLMEQERKRNELNTAAMEEYGQTQLLEEEHATTSN